MVGSKKRQSTKIVPKIRPAKRIANFFFSERPQRTPEREKRRRRPGKFSKRRLITASRLEKLSEIERSGGFEREEGKLLRIKKPRGSKEIEKFFFEEPGLVTRKRKRVKRKILNVDISVITA